jgi:hypothetical protein
VRLAGDLERFVTRLSADRGTDPPARELESYQYLNPVTAVWRYKAHLVPYWLAGVGLDIFPLAILLLILVGIIRRSPQEQVRDDVLALSVRDIILAQAGAGASRDASHNPLLSRDLVDHPLRLTDEREMPRIRTHQMIGEKANDKD